MPTPSEWPIRPVEPLKWLNDRIEAGKPACYLRFNDGEAYSMFRMKRAPESNGEHVYSDRMRRSLLKTFVSACCESVEDESVLVGSWWYEDVYNEASVGYQDFMVDAGNLHDEVRWGRGHIYHREEGNCPNEELLRLIRLLKDYRKVKVMIGNTMLEPVSKGLGMHEFGSIPRTNAESVVRVFTKSDLVIWCGGFPIKEWAWYGWVHKYNKIVIDAGSLFDGLVGNVSREWLKPGLPHSDFYYGEFRKAVLG